MKQLIQKNLLQTSEDDKRKSFASNFLRKSGAGKGQAKPKRESQESYSREDFLNRRYSDDVNSQDSRAASQCQSLNKGAQSEPLKRSHRVCFQEPGEKLEATRRHLSSTDSYGESEKNINHPTLKENPEVNSTAQTDQSKLRDAVFQSHLYCTDNCAASRKVPNYVNLGFNSRELDLSAQTAQSNLKLRKPETYLPNANTGGESRKISDYINVGFEPIEKPVLTSNQAKPSHPEDVMAKASDLPLLTQQDDMDSDKTDSPQSEIKVPQRPERPSLSKQSSVAEKVSLGFELKCEKNKAVLDQETYVSSTQLNFKEVGPQGSEAPVKCQPLSDQKPCTEIWTPKRPEISPGQHKEWKSLKFDPDPDKFPKCHSEQWTPTSSRLITGKIGLENSIGMQTTPLNETRSIPATPKLGRHALQKLGNQSSTESPLKLHRSCSVPRRQPPSPTNFKTEVVWKYPPCQDRTSSIPQESSAANVPNNHDLAESDSSSQDSLNSLDLSTLPSRFPESQQQTVGTLQREMNALFEQKMREIRCRSPLFTSGKLYSFTAHCILMYILTSML